ncbi:hypothetical protein ACFL1I_05800 [Candidatus Omnitrophota bacterium]
MTGNVFGQQAQEDIPPGMEVIQEGRLKVIVPQDAKRRQDRNLTVVESTEAYLSRRFLQIQASLENLEAQVSELKTKQAQLEKEIEQLKHQQNN